MLTDKRREYDVLVTRVMTESLPKWRTVEEINEILNKNYRLQLSVTNATIQNWEVARVLEERVKTGEFEKKNIKGVDKYNIY